MAKICAACNQEITGACLTADGGTFHPECFKCDGCGELLKGGFVKKEGKRICQNCTPKVVCAGCKQNISGGIMRASDKTYHPECFKCEGCSTVLSSGFFMLAGKTVCKACCDKGQEEATPRKTCRRCKKPIDGKVVFGDKDDSFHEECFTCEECSCELDTFVVDESRKFSYQDARYLCAPCYKKTIEAPAVTGRTCCVCKGSCLPDDTSLHLMDGYSLHWSCFKCSSCGKQEESSGDTSTRTLLRSRVDAVKKGTYLCDGCLKKATHTNLGPAPDLKVTFKAVYGSYVGKHDEKPGHHTSYAIKLMDGGRCWLDCTTSTPISSGSWHAEGTYTEDLNDAGHLKAIQFTVTAIPFGGGPQTGKVFDFAVEKGDPHDVLVCEGVRCQLCVGVPDYEIAQMMKPPEKMAAPKPVPGAANSQPGSNSLIADSEVTSVMMGSAGVMQRSQIDTSNSIIKTQAQEVAPVKPVPKEVPEGCYSLDDLRDANVWKTKDIDVGSRELYLSDAAFDAVFGMSKSVFKAMPKWKKDKAKKDHGLF